MTTNYGIDLSATDTIDATRTVTGERLLAEAAYRRLITPRGKLRYAPNYGLCLSDLLNADVTNDFLAGIPALVRAELLKDERLQEVNVTYSVDRTAAPSIAITLDIEGIAKDGGEFSLVLKATEVTVELLGIGGANG